MKFAISNHALRNGGGIERYAMTIVRGFHACGIKPIFLAKAFDTSLPEYGWVQPVRAPVVLVPGKLRDLLFDWHIGRAKRRLGLFPLLACNQTRWSDIGICGSTHPGFLAAMARTAYLSDHWKISLECAHLKGSRVVVAHSARMVDEAMRHYGLERSKFRLIYPPVDGDRFSPVDANARRALRTKFGLSDDRAVFLLASTGHVRKGLDLVTEIFARTDLPATLVVAGRPIQGSKPNVRYLGYRSDIEDVYRAADFTVLASRYEPFGLVGVESVLSGTPVVLADNAGCAEVIREPAQIPFSLAQAGSLSLAITVATERWRLDSHRLDSPLSMLAYDSRVSVHVDALRRLIDTIGAADRLAPDS